MSFIYGAFEEYHPNQILRVIRSFGFLRLDTGPWVAGGAVRRVINNENYDADIDIFFPNNGFNFERCKRILLSRDDFYEKNRRRIVIGTNELAMNFESQQFKIQLINFETHQSAEKLISDFDFTICMAATDGWNYVKSESFDNDLKSKSLVINKTKNTSMLRLQKYCDYGFEPLPETMDRLFNIYDDEFLKEISPEGVMPISSKDYK